MNSSATVRSSRLKARCTRKELLEAAQAVGHAVSGRSTLPILNHIIIESEEGRLRLSATDLEVGMSLTIAATIVEEGALTVPAKVLTELLGSLADASVEISVDRSDAARIQCARADYTLNGLPADEYPHLPEVPDTVGFSIEQRELRSMIRHTVVAVSSDESRAIMTGVLMEISGTTLKCVATDTHRLAIRSAQVAPAGAGEAADGAVDPFAADARLLDAQGHQAIVPGRAMDELNKALGDAPGLVHVRMSDTQIQFETPRGVTLVSRLIEGKYPPIDRVIPSSTSRQLTIQIAELLPAVRRAAIVARNSANRVRLSTEGDKLIITAESVTDGFAREEIDVVVEGEPVEVAFNAKFLQDVLAVLDDHQGCYLSMNEPTKPCLVRPAPRDGDEAPIDYLYVLMPMQLT